MPVHLVRRNNQARVRFADFVALRGIEIHQVDVKSGIKRVSAQYITFLDINMHASTRTIFGVKI